MKFKVEITEDMDIKDIERKIQEACDAAKAEAKKAYEDRQAKAAKAREEKKRKDDIAVWRGIVADDFARYFVALGIVPEDEHDDLMNFTEKSLRESEDSFRQTQAMVDMIIGGLDNIKKNTREDVKCGSADKEDMSSTDDDEDALIKFLKSLN